MKQKTVHTCVQLLRTYSQFNTEVCEEE